MVQVKVNKFMSERDYTMSHILSKAVLVLCIITVTVSCGGGGGGSGSNEVENNSTSDYSCVYTLDVTSPNAPTNIKALYRGTACTNSQNLCLETLTQAASSLGFTLSSLTDYSTEITATSLCTEKDIEYVEETAETFEMQAGCHLSTYNGLQSSQFGCGILNSTGNFSLDQRINEEVGIQNKWFNLITPATVYLFDECPGNKNALSNPANFILMGNNLLLDILFGFGTEIPYAAVMGHEFAHQVQFEYGWMDVNANTVRDTELEADVHAAYYLLYNKHMTINVSDIEAFLINAYNIGDYQFNNKNHHGTPTERFNASVFGMVLASESINRGQVLTNLEVHQYAKDYISRGLPTNVTYSLASEYISPEKISLLSNYYNDKASFSELMKSKRKNYVKITDENR